jgi:hypothetical protein
MSPTGLRGRAPETSRAVAYGPSFKKLDRERSDRALYPSPAKRWGGKAEAKRKARVGGCLDTPHPDAHFIRVFPPHHSLTLVGEG